MKKNFLLLVLAFVCPILTNAQLTEGSITYSMEFSSKQKDAKQAIEMMEGSELNIYFKDDNTRADIKMGSLMEMKTVTNSKSEKFLILMDMSMMGIKYAVNSSLAELEEKNKKEKPKMDIELVKGSKTILGYSCKKAIGTDEDGNKMTFWYTEDIVVNKRGQSYLNHDIPGFPLQYQIMQKGLKMSMTATNFEKSLDAEKAKKLFNMDIPEGYEEKTLLELMK
jgi:GLPGLI family protein